MSPESLTRDARALGLALFLAVTAFGVGVVMGTAPLHVPLLLVLAVSVAGIAFVRAELAIHLLIVSMLLSPEFALTGPIGQGSLDATRSAVVRLEDFLLLIIGAGWLARVAVHKKLGVVLSTPLNLPVMLYAVVLAATTLLGAAAGRVQPLVGSLYVLKYLEYFVIYFLAVNHVRDPKALRRMLITATATAILVSLVALAQIPTGQRVSAPFEGEHGEPNTLGGYLVLMMAVLGGIALELPRRRHRLALGAVVALMAVPLLYTLSRSSWLAAAVASAVLLLATRQRRRLLAVLLGAVPVAWLAVPSAVAERVAYTFQPHRNSLQISQVALDPSTSERIRSWMDTFHDAAVHPILGHGVTGYHFIDAQYFRILAECGLVGLLAFAFLVFTVLKVAWDASRRVCAPLYRGLASGFVAATAGMLAHGLGANTFLIVRIMEPFWLIAALVVVATRLDAEAESSHAPE